MNQANARTVFEILANWGFPNQPVINVLLPADMHGQYSGMLTHLKYASFYMPARETIDGMPLTILGTKGTAWPDAVELLELPFAQFEAYVKRYRALTFEHFGISPMRSSNGGAVTELINFVESQFPVRVDELPAKFCITKNANGRIPAVKNCRDAGSPFQRGNGGEKPACEIFHHTVNSEITWARLEAQFESHRDALGLELDIPRPQGDENPSHPKMS